MKKKISMFLAVMTLLTLIVSPLMYVRAADDEDDEVPAPDVTHAKADVVPGDSILRETIGGSQLSY